MRALLAPLTELADYEEIYKTRKKKHGMIQITGCVASQRTHLMYALSDDFQNKIIVLSSAEKAERLYEEYRFLEEETYLYPAKDMLFYHADIKGKLLLKKRMEVVQALLDSGKSGITVVTSMDGFMDGLPNLLEIEKHILRIHSGEALDFTTIQTKLAAIGYEREEQIEGPWTVCSERRNSGYLSIDRGIADPY